MSIKIYSGFRFPAKMFYAKGFITSLKAAMYDVLVDQLQENWQAVAKEITEKKFEGKDLWIQKHLAESKTDKQRMYCVLEWSLSRPNVVDAFTSTLVVFPGRIWCLGWIANAYGGIEGKVYSSLMKIPGIEEYGYWNNTDRLDTITKAEWNARGKAWDNVQDTDRVFIQGICEASIVNVSMYVQQKLGLGWYD